MEELFVSELSVKYRYGALAVSDLTFSTKKGILCVFGENESGKTSLLKTLAGLVRPVSGTIRYDDTVMNDFSPERRNVVLLYEDGGFFENRTAEYNLRYPLKVRKIPEERWEPIVRTATERVGFEPVFLRERVKKLPQRQRILLSYARAYTRNADLYLVDDALKTAEDREETFSIVKPFLEEFAQDAVVLYATDRVEECEALGGKILFLHYGIPMFFGTVDEIRKEPPDLTAVEKFCPEAETESPVLQADGERFVFRAFGEDHSYEKRALLSDVFLGKTVVAVRMNGTILLYDLKSERRIFFLTDR